MSQTLTQALISQLKYCIKQIMVWVFHPVLLLNPELLLNLGLLSNPELL